MASGRRKRALPWAPRFLALVAMLGSLALPNWPGAQAAERVRPVAVFEGMDPAEAARVARLVSEAHGEVSAVWRREMRLGHGRSYRVPELVVFTQRRFGPCAPAAGIGGAGYCPRDRTISLELASVGSLMSRLGDEAPRALLLLFARLAADHLQTELAIRGDADRQRPELAAEAQGALDRELALQGDCFTGAWARRASSAGPVEDRAWARFVVAVSAEAPEAAAWLDGAAVEEREAAFRRGFDGGSLRSCLAPGLSGVLG